jgi:hypothetical protein
MRSISRASRSTPASTCSACLQLCDELAIEARSHEIARDQRAHPGHQHAERHADVGIQRAGGADRDHGAGRSRHAEHVQEAVAEAKTGRQPLLPARDRRRGHGYLR